MKEKIENKVSGRRGKFVKASPSARLDGPWFFPRNRVEYRR